MDKISYLDIHARYRDFDMIQYFQGFGETQTLQKNLNMIQKKVESAVLFIYLFIFIHCYAFNVNILNVHI